MARLTRFDHDGLTFDVDDAGPEDGAPVVLLHGFPQRATMWAGVAPLLHEAGLRTLAPDQRGYSSGARPRGRAAYGLGRVVGDVAALVERLGAGPVHLMGHDWGAAAAWSTAASRPELLRSLVAVSVPHPAAMARALRTRDQLRRSWYMGFFQLPWLPELALSRPALAGRFLGASGMDREMVARYGREIVGDGALRGALGWYRAMPLTARGATGGSGLARRVRVPTTYVWSDGDVALGRLGAELSAEHVVADYRFEVLPGLSHWIPDEAPERLARIALERFLE
ncbi:alpha/beta fold hydrolase [Nocardioides mangrovicus]|nr:alpha/beta fold hydrolase [Nocardioides mangrovicus]